MKDLGGKILKLREDLTLVSVEDSGALLDVEKKCYYDLNSTAFFITSLLDNGYQYDAIQVAVISEFNVNVKTARPDIDNFIDELLRHGLLGVEEEIIELTNAYGGKRATKPYQAPIIEYNAELAVACAPTGPT